MKGLERFISARKDGRLLSKTVLVWIGRDGAIWWKWKELFTFPECRVDSPKEDFRPLVGLDVILVSDRYTALDDAIYQKMKGYARSIVFAMLDVRDGLYWSKEHGEREL